MITTVTGKNQISIPTALANELGLKPGSRIDWSLSDQPDQLVCRILPDPATVAAGLRGAGRKYLKAGKPHPLKALRDERSAGDKQRMDVL
ncbi:MAG: AbrB/MazE/SpoVT family DNA-binding domain-containing protein [Luteolibacter sp.]|uniref:AbrB/MazE/SpoVT family DNA-binding domain-containing protein n=1 Tax=Luteolibacter sp. TaxID=1962973 RepID=UPI0032668B8F